MAPLVNKPGHLPDVTALIVTKETNVTIVLKGFREMVCLECSERFAGNGCNICADGYYGDSCGKEISIEFFFLGQRRHLLYFEVSKL